MLGLLRRKEWRSDYRHYWQGRKRYPGGEKAIKRERQKLQNSLETWNHFSKNEMGQAGRKGEVENLSDRFQLADLGT